MKNDKKPLKKKSSRDLKKSKDDSRRSFHRRSRKSLNDALKNLQ